MYVSASERFATTLMVEHCKGQDNWLYVSAIMVKLGFDHREASPKEVLAHFLRLPKRWLHLLPSRAFESFPFFRRPLGIRRFTRQGQKKLDASLTLLLRCPGYAVLATLSLGGYPCTLYSARCGFVPVFTDQKRCYPCTLYSARSLGFWAYC